MTWLASSNASPCCDYSNIQLSSSSFSMAWLASSMFTMIRTCSSIVFNMTELFLGRHPLHAHDIIVLVWLALLGSIQFEFRRGEQHRVLQSLVFVEKASSPQEADNKRLFVFLKFPEFLALHFDYVLISFIWIGCTCQFLVYWDYITKISIFLK